MKNSRYLTFTAALILGLLAGNPAAMAQGVYTAQKVGSFGSQKKLFVYDYGYAPGENNLLPSQGGGKNVGGGVPYGTNTTDHDIIVYFVYNGQGTCTNIDLSIGQPTTPNWWDNPLPTPIAIWGMGNPTQRASVSGTIPPGYSWRIGNCPYAGNDGSPVKVVLMVMQ